MNRVMDEYEDIINGDGGNTGSSYPTIEEKLKEGDYVTYPSSQGNLECIVLYDNTSGYGVQLITSDVVGSNITLGVDDDFDASKDSYNNAVGTLNTEAGNYNNDTYSTRARCVGSHPTNTNDTTTYFTSSEDYMSSYNGQFKNADVNYDIDYKKMQTINGGIHNIGKEYWLASRFGAISTHLKPIINSYVSVYSLLSSGVLNCNNSLCLVNINGNTYADSYSYGLRPVFILKSGIKITGGNGESGTPYTLGV